MDWWNPKPTVLPMEDTNISEINDFWNKYVDQTRPFHVGMSLAEYNQKINKLTNIMLAKIDEKHSTTT